MKLVPLEQPGGKAPNGSRGRVLHVIPSVGPSRGGPSLTVREFADGLINEGFEVHIATTDDDDQRRMEVPLNQPVSDGRATWHFFPRQAHFWTFSWPLAEWLRKNIQQYDVVHIHAIFSFATWPAAIYARRSGVPYLVCLHGMLNRWCVRERRPRLKALQFRLVDHHLLRSAAGIICANQQEWVEAQEFGAEGTPMIVPNFIDWRQILPMLRKGEFRRRHPHLSDKRLLLFLSRIDRKKGFDLLLPAFAQLLRAHSDVRLVVAGSGTPDYEARLRAEARRLNIEENVFWAGFLSGQAKWDALCDADVFVLPSHSESFGMAVVEAMLAGCPIVMTDQIGIHTEVQRADAGLVVPCAVPDVCAALDRIFTEAPLRNRLARNGRRLAQEAYSPEAVVQVLANGYDRMISESRKRLSA